MKSDQADPYPGETTTTIQVLQLANVYFHAANTLFEEAKRQGGQTYTAPARFCAIHSIELFLHAFLRCEGVTPGEIRARRHNVADEKFVEKLKLRTKTAIHLKTLSERREYLIARYAPDMLRKQSELNRLTATLVEVKEKAGVHVEHSKEVKSKGREEVKRIDETSRAPPSG